MTCPSCGHPNPAGAAPCARCVGPDGAPIGFEPVLARATEELVATQGLDPVAAEAAARAYLGQLPAWRRAPAGADGPATVRIEAGVGDLAIRGVPGLAAPRLRDGDEDFRLVETPAGWLVHPRDAEDRWGEAVGDLDLEVPADVAEVQLTLRCGDLEVRDLPGRLTARLQTGDIDIRDVGALALWLQAGDIALAGTFDGGEHRVELMSGDLEVRLERGADVRLSLELTAGDAELDGFAYRLDRSAAGAQRYEATLGEGRGRLALVVQAGDVEVLAR